MTIYFKDTPSFLKPKKNKYGAKKVVTDYYTFDSKAEYQRDLVLFDLEKNGIIKDLKRQVSYELKVNGILICKYIADWTYIIVKNDKFVVEDMKGVETGVFKLKKKLMNACYGIDVWANKFVNAHPYDF